VIANGPESALARRRVGVGHEQHILLLIEYRKGHPVREPVHAESLGDGLFRLLYTPGLVQGIAAGDEFRLVDADGAFEVVRRKEALRLHCLLREMA
jgi:hypothetical protein